MVPNFWYDGTFTRKSDDPERWAAFIQKERDQITEFLTRYGPIDTLCLDMHWCPEGPGRAYGVAKLARSLSPTSCCATAASTPTAITKRPRGQIPGNPNQMKRPWQVIYPCGSGVFLQEARYLQITGMGAGKPH